MTNHELSKTLASSKKHILYENTGILQIHNTRDIIERNEYNQYADPFLTDG